MWTSGGDEGGDLAVSFESCGMLGMAPAFLSLRALSAEGVLAQCPLPRLEGKVGCVQCPWALGHSWAPCLGRGVEGAPWSTLLTGLAKHRPLPGRRELLHPPPCVFMSCTLSFP